LFYAAFFEKKVGAKNKTTYNLKKMTIKEHLKLLYTELKKSKIENPRLEAELIIENILKVNKKYLILNPNKEINKNNLNKIKNHLEKRLNLYPMAYIKKEKYFYNLKFFVNKDVLIPRPESELIIDEIIKKTKDNSEATTIMDIGTGSGCLIINLANILSKNKKIDFYGIDICQKALKIAEKNAKLNKAEKNVKFIQSDLLQKIIDKKIKLKEKIIITANLPYLTKEEIKNSPSIKFEPVKALDGGKDGLRYYKKILSQVKKIKNKKNHIEIYMEISDWQNKVLILEVKNILKNYKVKIKTIKDLTKQNRLILVSL